MGVKLYDDEFELTEGLLGGELELGSKDGELGLIEPPSLPSSFVDFEAKKLEQPISFSTSIFFSQFYLAF